jgi:DNA polymerase-3 subunit gamma/tau
VSFYFFFEKMLLNRYNEKELSRERGIVMAYQALYRLYRPQRFQDVVGQEHITKTLQNALLQEKLSHAYLFSGPRGTGKTSAAKIIAKAINCERAPVGEPCNECDACTGITNGSISDVIEIDAASNNGVDEIRDIRDKVKYAPSAVSFKVYIIDEVHMLSIGAFNALLKTLEEPPKHVIFILATTEPHKIPLTIISRCQRFDFKRITNQALVSRMETIIRTQDITVETEALHFVARAAEGGMRDALSLLDQAISYSDNRVTVDDVLAITGAVSQSFLSDIAKAFLDSDVVGALRSVEKLMETGKDPARFIADLIYYFRDMLLYQTAPGLEEVLERAKVDDQVESIAKESSKEWLYYVIETLNQCQQEMRWSNHPRIFLELALVKISQEEKKSTSEPISTDESLLKRIEQLEQELTTLKKQGVTAQSQEQPNTQAAGQRTYQSQSPKVKASTGKIKEMLKKASKQDLQRLKSQWGDIMEKIRIEKVSAHAWLKDSEPVACSKDMFLLSFQHELHSQMAVKDNIRSCVETVIGDTIGMSLTMMTILYDDWEQVKQSFIKEQRGSTDENEENKDDKVEQEDKIISEAIKLVGEDLVEIKD